MKTKDTNIHSGLRMLTDLVENHYFANAYDLQRASEIGEELAMIEQQEEPQRTKTLKKQELYLELRTLSDTIISRELGGATVIDGIPLNFLERAIELAEKSIPEDSRVHPKVGAVILKNNIILAEGFRNQDGEGGHAEEIAIQKCKDIKQLEGATTIATLEPCTIRGSRGRRPCSEILIHFGIKKVMIGLLDPNPEIRGRCDMLLRKNGIKVGYFPSDLSARIWEMNREFIEMNTADDFKTVFSYNV